MTDYKDPAVIRFYTECMDKERNRRIKWFMNNLEKIRECANNKSGTTGSETSALLDKFKAELESVSDVKPREKVMHEEEKVEGEDVYKIMKPVAEDVHQLLYSSEKGDGRELYFRKRFKMNPEDKFYFTECTSWDYGWKLSRSNLPRGVHRPRIAEIKQSFYRKSNVARDPDHYKKPGLLKNICFTD